MKNYIIEHISKYYKVVKIESYSIKSVLYIKEFKIIDLETNQEIHSHQFYSRLMKIFDIDDRQLQNILNEIVTEIINKQLSNQIKFDYGEDNN
jgi:hypothetical protein